MIGVSSDLPWIKSLVKNCISQDLGTSSEFMGHWLLVMCGLVNVQHVSNELLPDRLTRLHTDRRAICTCALDM